MNFELAKRTRRHPLTRPQIEVLRKLSDGNPRATARSTFGVYICGTATAALERRGLVKMRARTWGDTKLDTYEYEITREGREALAKVKP